MSSIENTGWTDAMPATCRICGMTGDHRILRLREMQFGLRDEFDYFECTQCGTVQIAEMPTDLSKFYPPTYYSFLADPESNPRLIVRTFFTLVRLFAPVVRYFLLSRGGIARAARSLAARFDLRLLILEVFQSTGVGRDASILDVGSGAGFIPYCLKQVGFRRVVGLDPFLREDRHYANGFSVLKSDLAGYVDSNPEPFDLVMFHHSLEHMANAAEPLHAVAKLLKPDGVILIRIPVVDCDAFDKYRENLVELDPPRHLFVPTQRALAIAAAATGLVVERIVHDSTDFQFWASEQYLRDIPLESERSYRRNRKGSIFNRSQIREFRRMAIECNGRGRGDTAAFFLRKREFVDRNSAGHPSK